MDEQRTAAVLGGDARQPYAARAFEAAGWEVRCYQTPEEPQTGEAAPSLEEALQGAEVVLLPVPYKGIDTAELCIHVTEEQTLFGLLLPDDLRTHCAGRGIACHDLLERGDFATLNAISTAEGAIAEAIAAGAGNLHLSQALVLGYGRCAKPLIKKLQGFGARVTVAARRWEAACAAVADGCEVLDFTLLPYHLPRFTYIFNTIPALVLEEAHLQRMLPEAVIVDIASAPGGVDFEAAQRLGVCAKLCLGLPGKYAPRAAGESIAQIARVILEEQEGAVWNRDWGGSAPVSG